MKQVWQLEEAELNRLVWIMLEHTRLALEAVENRDAQRRDEIKAKIEELRQERFEILGR